MLFMMLKCVPKIAYNILKDQDANLNDLVENQNFKYGVFGQNGFIKKIG